MAFPCNQFGKQAPGTSQDEREFAYSKTGLTSFPVFDKIECNGEGSDPLYSYLRKQQPISFPSRTAYGVDGALEWNYVKFLVGRDGTVLRRYQPGYDPVEFETDVRLALSGATTLTPIDCRVRPSQKACQPPLDELLGPAGKWPRQDGKGFVQA
mmetsp:Transcript_16370/g.51452  ORF Transcript_16370/g.51452 Transcript_16370/m.51452 type:complete len:154 (-) Transcript_16370:408-869(-)